MKATLFLLLAVFSSVLPFAAHSQILVTFDDLDASHAYSYATNIPNGYQGLSWSNLYVGNEILRYNAGYTNDGYRFGLVSPSNNVFNGSGFPAEIDSPGTNFDFLSAYFTGAWNSNLNIEVQGFSDTNLVYDETKVASATSPTLFTFDYLDIDRLYFNSYGGESAGFAAGAGENFVMDNFTFEFIPEPSSLLLTVLGVVSLWAFVKPTRRTA